MKLRHSSLLIGILAVLASAVAYSLRPSLLMADAYPRMPLALEMPTVLQRWQKVSNDIAVVDPTQEAVLEYLYAETFAATYRDHNNHLVMLSVAYGRDQSDGHEVHKPDLCYPAQGFSILESTPVNLKIGADYSISAKYLKTVKGDRPEPLLYWTTVGNRTYQGKLEKKRIGFEYALKNLIPDGLVVRVSTIENDEEEAKRFMNDFVSDWYAGASEASRQRFFGKGI